jgi:Carboxypeptidase regulatory-like domain
VPTASPKPSPLLTGAILTLALHASLSLAQPPAEATSYRIAGHIVSSTTGRPLPRATIEMLRTKTYRVEASTVAGEDGSFAFTNVPAGAFVLAAKHPGYIASRYDAHDGYSTAIVTGAGVDTESLVFKLAPEASISGRITDESGDPVRHANIALYRENLNTGSPHITRVGGANTDTTGTYDIAHLAPGKYFLSATATPWYAVHPQPERQGRQGIVPIAVVESYDPNLDVAYPITFYPEATDSTGAAPITLKGGDQMELSLRLTPQTALTINIQHSPDDKSNNFPQLQLQRQVFDNLEYVNTEMRGSSSGTSIVGIPPGQYVVRQIDPQNGRPTRATSIDLTEHTTQFDPARGEELARVKILVKTADGTKLPARTTLALVPKDATQAEHAPVNDKGEAEINSVKPGEYYFDLSLANKKYFVTRLLADGKPLPNNRIQIAAGANISVTIIAAPGTGTVTGFAKASGTPAPGVMILMLSTDKLVDVEEFWKDQTDLDGSFILTDIPPGRYNLLAIQDGWDLAWQRNEVLAHYLPLAVPVTIPDTANPTLKLPDPIPVQSR